MEILAHRGPYGFATRDLVLVDATRPTPANNTCSGSPVRTLPTRVFHPAWPATRTASPPPPQPVPVAGGGPFPLLAYAHGLTSRGESARHFVEHLASHGYFVAVPLFPLSNGGAPGGPTFADMANQAGDLGFVQDRLGQLDGSNADIAAAADTQRRGLLGFSAGGLTVLIAAHHPVLHLQNIDAAVVHAPVSCFLGPGSFAQPVPLTIIAGTADELVPLPGPEKVYALAPPPVTLVELVGGNHAGFMNTERLFVQNTDRRECELLLTSGGTQGFEAFEADITAGVGPDALDPSGCTPLCSEQFTQTMGATRQIKLARAATLAHFEAVLRGNAYAAAFLEHALDDLPDVEVSTKP